MKLKVQTKQMIDVGDWDALVTETYGKPYNFQQQDGCKDRGTYTLTVPDDNALDYEEDTVTEEVNHEEMGVSFDAWLARDPKQKIPNQEYDWELDLWWMRNFYPSIEMISNDLFDKGLLEAGEYVININW